MLLFGAVAAADMSAAGGCSWTAGCVFFGAISTQTTGARTSVCTATDDCTLLMNTD
jgi:hypothetical protein